MDLEFSVAEPSDDPAIRRLLADTPMPGAVTVSFQREPNYFIGESVMGKRCITLRAVDREHGTLAGIICLASEDRFIRDIAEPVGYVGQLRIRKDYQGYMIPLRAMPFIRHIASNGWPNTWFSVFADENPEALSIFVEKARSSLPQMVRVAGITTSAILTSARTPNSDVSRWSNARLISGERVELTEIAHFLHREGKEREFFPAYEIEDLASAGEASGGRFPSLLPSNFIVAEDERGIAGVGAVWDQSSYKQAVVSGYRGILAGIRPFYNAASRVFPMHPLPEVGTPIHSSYLSFFAVRDNDIHIARALLTRAVLKARTCGKDYLMFGLTDTDPLQRIVERFRRITYRSTMYAFRLDGNPPVFDREKPPYVEIATL